MKRTCAKRYSQAVFEIAKNTEEFDRWRSDLIKIANLSRDTKFITVMENPRIRFVEKSKLLRRQLHDISSLALNLVYLLVTKGILSIATDVTNGYQKLLDGYLGIEQVVVTTAVSLRAEDETRLKEQLSAAVGKEIVIFPKVDSNIIGGIIIKIGDKLIDSSTRGKLIALKREMAL